MLHDSVPGGSGGELVPQHGKNGLFTVDINTYLHTADSVGRGDQEQDQQETFAYSLSNPLAIRGYGMLKKVASRFLNSGINLRAWSKTEVGRGHG